MATDTLAAIFRQAADFEFSAMILQAHANERMGRWESLSEEQRRFPTWAPTIVNSAFALELYLKCLLLIDGKTSRGHKLATLYSQLSQSRRQQIHDGFEKTKPKDCATFTVVQILLVANKAFEMWRYAHEGTVCAYFGGAVCVTVRKVIVEIKPELAKWLDLDLPKNPPTSPAR